MEVKNNAQISTLGHSVGWGGPHWAKVQIWRNRFVGGGMKSSVLGLQRLRCLWEVQMEISVAVGYTDRELLTMEYIARIINKYIKCSNLSSWGKTEYLSKRRLCI